MNIPTTEKLFDHKCLFKDMKLSGFNPESLSYYCNVCGGKLMLKKTKKADEYIKENASLKFSRQLFLLCTEEDKKSEKEKTPKKTTQKSEKQAKSSKTSKAKSKGKKK